MSILIGTLNYALSRRRPHKGVGEAELRAFVQKRLGGTIDSFGNLHVDRTNGASRTLFVAHLDTVHHTDGHNAIDRSDAHVWRATMGQPLGADDGAGVAMLVHMAVGGVPGYYLFTLGEECGGHGAKFVAKHNRDLLKRIDRAIAFDRKACDSVISHQGWGRCCSDEFALTLAAALNDASSELFMYSPDDTGVYTDTAEFVDDVAECTNISVGYSHEHSDKESLDMRHYIALSEAVLKIDWETLPVVRPPGYDDTPSWASAWRSALDKEEREMQSLGGRQWFDLYDALDSAEHGQWAALSELLAENIHPNDPALARSFVNRLRMESHHVDFAWELIEQGYTYEDVLTELFVQMEAESPIH